MQDPTTLFSYEPHVDSRTLHGRTLLITLGAFSDAGQAQELVDDHLVNTMQSRVIGRLDLDQLYDYAGRRPEVTLEVDHFTDYERPELLLHEVTGENGEPFYLLSGPEPSFQWERVASALRIVVEQLGIERTLVLQGFPSPVPHTRDLHVTRFAGQSDDIRVRRTMPGTFRLRAPFTALLTLRLAEAEHSVVGMVVHVPQYLHDVTYPDAAISLLQAVAEEDGPQVDLTGLEERALPVRESLTQQMAQSEQIREVVAQLEAQYDRMITAGAGDEVPTAEELAAEFEQYLANLDDHPEGGENPSASDDPVAPTDPVASDDPFSADALYFPERSHSPEESDPPEDPHSPDSPEDPRQSSS